MQKENIEAVLKDYQCPYMGTDLVSANTVKDITVDGNNVSIKVVLGWPAEGIMQAFHENLNAKVMDAYPDAKLTLDLSYEIIPHTVQQSIERIKGIKNIIAIASGKGGVGKSTVAASLAVALSQLGAKVGVLDADIYGPSMPLMFDLVNKKPVVSNDSGRNLIEPIVSHGVGILSIGFFTEASQSVPWRGPMVSKALTQLFQDTDWGSLDYLLVDLPPGTGDIHLTLVDKIPLAGAIVVSTPQEVALADARKGIDMFRMPMVNVPVLGLIENMAYYIPKDSPDKKDYIFGKDGAKKLAEEMNVPLLGQIPLITAIREAGDIGAPAALNENTIEGKIFKALANNVIECIKKPGAFSPKEKVEA